LVRRLQSTISNWIFK